MIRQEVNLYTAEFRGDRQPLSSRTMVRAVCGLFALLLLVEAFTVWNLYGDRDLLQVRQQAELTISQRLNQLKASRPFSERSRLEQEIENLRAEVERRQELKALISGQNLGNANGFSPFMEAMARQASDDVSLTTIRLLDGGDYLELAGWTRRPEAVPYYLSRLRDERSFEKVKFGVLGISKDEVQRNKLQFSLGRPDEGSS